MVIHLSECGVMAVIHLVECGVMAVIHLVEWYCSFLTSVSSIKLRYSIYLCMQVTLLTHFFVRMFTLCNSSHT